MEANPPNQTPDILIVDSDKEFRRRVTAFLSQSGCRCRSALSAESAIKQLRHNPTDLLITNLQLPDQNGKDFYMWVAKNTDCAAIITTEKPDEQPLVECIKMGAYVYLHKPLSLQALQIFVNRALERRAHLPDIQNGTRQIQGNAQQSRRNEQTMRNLQRAKSIMENKVHEIIHRLSLAAEYRDEDTWFHLHRIAAYSRMIADRLSLSQEFTAMLEAASPLHDVGKVGISDSILLKPDKLTDEEFKLIQTHTTIGAKILRGSKQPLINLAHDIALYHHEKFNGKGYPRGLQEDEIPLAARIVAVADVYDALTSERPYKAAWPHETAIEEIHAERGKHFDPEVADAFLADTVEVLQKRESLNRGLAARER